MKLKHNYKLYYSKGSDVRKNMSKEDFQKMLKPLKDFGTVEEFWDLFLHMKLPTQLGMKSKIFVFKEHIFPSWEDAHNKDGGRIYIKLPLNPETDEIWQNVVLEFLCALK